MPTVNELTSTNIKKKKITHKNEVSLELKLTTTQQYTHKRFSKAQNRHCFYTKNKPISLN